jgi:WD40 repeat protein/tRNA A-37 threonylcarbamoyl transferase component Bud32
MPAVDFHPSHEELEAFALGQLPDDAHTAVEEHVNSCSECRVVIDRTPGDRLVTLLRSAASVSETVKAIDKGATLTSTADTPSAATSVTCAFPLAEATNPSELPPALTGHPRYEPTRLLGSGGMGTVWLAQHCVMGRQVAVKVIRPEFVAKPGAAERFRRETQAAARLQHPNIVTAFDAEQAGDTHLLAMEYVEGVTLSDIVRQRGPLPVTEACDAIRQAALGLQHAFDRGLIHRDLKPHNLMRTADGTVKILDFGLAVLADAARGADGLTAANIVLGTPDYIAPEQAEDSHAADVRSDIYSLGCSLYHLLTGRVPFPGDSVLRKLDSHRMLQPEPIQSIRPEVPAALAAIVAKMMAKKPGDRFQTPDEVAAALTPFVAGSVPIRKRWGPWLAVAAALLFTGMIAAGMVFYIKTDNGTIEIHTDDENIKIIAERNGKEVHVLDPTSKQTWVVDTGKWTVRLDGKPDGLTLEMPKTFTLKRGDKQVVTIKRVKDLVVIKPPAEEKVSEARRIRWEGGGRIFNTAVSSDSRYYLAAGDPDIVRLWDLKTGKRLHEFRGYVAYFTPDSKQVLTGSWEGSQFRLYDTITGKEIRRFGGERADLWNFRISPDGKQAWSITGDRTVHVWDLSTGTELHKWTAQTTNIVGAFSSDGKRIVLSLDNRPTRVLDLETGKEVRAYENILDKKTLYKLLPGDREVMAYRDKEVMGVRTTTLQFYEVASGKLLQELDLGKRANYAPESLSPDGRRFLSVYPDGTHRLWDVTTGKLIDRFEMLDGRNPRAAFISPDGRYATGCSDGGSVYLWRLPAPTVAKDKP